jgi:hypothetical protein
MNKPKDKVLERFMKEFFPYGHFKKTGFFTPEMKGNYAAQAKRVCDFFGFESVYEYGGKVLMCHITYGGDDLAGLGTSRPMHIDNYGELKAEPFITVIPSIYE